MATVSTKHSASVPERATANAGSPTQRCMKRASTRQRQTVSGARDFSAEAAERWLENPETSVSGQRSRDSV
jgi:endonuclease YncB( thermonuclease family)